jgi:hypothetical protein
VCVGGGGVYDSTIEQWNLVCNKSSKKRGERQRERERKRETEKGRRDGRHMSTTCDMHTFVGRARYLPNAKSLKAREPKTRPAGRMW